MGKSICVVFLLFEIAAGHKFLMLVIGQQPLLWFRVSLWFCCLFCTANCFVRFWGKFWPGIFLLVFTLFFAFHFVVDLLALTGATR